MHDVRRQSHARLRADFESFFQSRNYEEVEPETLIPQVDSSLLFTNSTTVPFKRKIPAQGKISGKHFVSQACLRFQNLKAYEQSPDNPHYLFYFTMHGCLMPHSPEAAVEDIVQFLRTVLQLKGSKIRVLADSRQAGLVSQIQALWADVSAEFDTKAESFYNWQYGVRGLTGRGVSFFYDHAGRTENLGQLIELYRDDVAIGFEFGFGVETLLYLQEGLPCPLAAALVCDGEQGYPLLRYQVEVLAEQYGLLAEKLID